MKLRSMRICKPSDALLPVVFLIASLLGRPAMALWLFVACLVVKLCALSASSGLRRAFAVQPSMRHVQGSTVLALLLQVPGALVASLIAILTHQNPAVYPLIACGMFLNFEHVFYEYLFALGDDFSAAMYHGVSSLLTLAGLLLCAPPSQSLPAPEVFSPLWLLGTTGISAMVGMTVSLILGGKPRPKINGEVLRCSPLTMLQSALYPAAALIALRLLAPFQSPSVPLFAGLILYELCRSPFRRSTAESRLMNRMLLISCALAAALAVICRCVPGIILPPVVLLTCLALIIAAVCAFALYGNIRRGRQEP